MFRNLKKWLMGWLKGGPHYVVGDGPRPYLRRWYVIPRNDWLCVYLHQFLRSDDDRALHNHPWAFVSLILRGGYYEHTESLGGMVRAWYRPGRLLFRLGDWYHRVELPEGKTAWTLVVTGQRVREWGFLCPKGWVHWREFTRSDKPGEVGRGCGD